MAIFVPQPKSWTVFYTRQHISYSVERGKTMRAKVSSKGQIVIPHKIRRKYSILPGKELQIEEEEGVIRLIVPAKLVNLCGTWEMDLDEVRREIEDLRERWRG